MAHGVWTFGGGGVDTSNSDVSGAKYPGKYNTKNSHTERLTLFIIHRDKPSSMYTNLH